MNLNPFDLRGPEFLVFYASLSLATAVAVWLVRHFLEAGGAGEEIDAASAIAQDPYQVAYLRGGRDEVLRIAVVSLLERGLLVAKADKLHATSSDALDKVRRPLDKALLTKFADAGKAQSIYTDEIILREAGVIAEPLKQRRLLPDAAAVQMRCLLVAAAVLFLWAIAGIKIAVALGRGRTNVAFLVILAIIVPVIVYKASKPFRTTLGSRTCRQLKELFSGLRSRRKSSRHDDSASELTFLAAVFGIGLLPTGFSAILAPLHLYPPRPVGSGGSNGGSSCGGGGCGGGGCGGGCGGCG
jgi:uncharacterized protein (TIGR04222 family)